MTFKHTAPEFILPKTLQGLVSALTHAQTLEELSGVFLSIPEKCNMFHGAYCFFGSDDKFLDPGNYICTTYPEEWQRRYYAENYLYVDPVIQRSIKSNLPFEWRDLEIEKGTVGDKILTEAQSFGLGEAALSIPLAGVDGSRGLFVITSADPHKFDGSARISATRDYQMLANYGHEAYLRIAASHSSGVVELSDEEKACLKLAADGLLGAEIAHKLKLSESVVRLCLRVARHKLGAATTDIAILNAIQFGVL